MILNFSAPTVKILPYFIHLILKYQNFKSTFSLEKSYELIVKIKDITLPHNNKLISFHVTNLFLNIPPIDVVNIIENTIFVSNTIVPIKNELRSLLNVC